MGSAALLGGDCSVANARQGTTLPALDALHSPPINTADRFATLTLTLKLLLPAAKVPYFLGL
jgi:hypothetical protein